ncbi:MAG: SGNH/GDSL hydrolase family protein [Muribaculum sp.]|nr:SGNH/GDSL hydrolase family protein [Muribaculum sp.]
MEKLFVLCIMALSVLSSYSQTDLAAVIEAETVPAKVANPDSSAIRLDGRTLCVFGDSYVRNHRRPVSETWHSKVASRLGMNYVNCGVNGSSILFDRSSEGFGKAMTERYKDLPDSIDCLLIIAGHNDASMIKSDAELAQFDNALEELLKNLKKRYPDADLGYVLPWNVDRGYFKQVIASIKRICGDYGIPVFDAEAAGGIKVNDPDYRAKYFQDKGVNDTAHLNADGHDLIVDKGADFIVSISK